MAFLEETDTEIIRNIHPSEMFVQDSFEIVEIGMGIKAVVGIASSPSLIQMRINPENKLTQSIRF